MVDINLLLQLIAKSTALDEQEKKALFIVVPFMKEEELQAMEKTFSIEQDVLNSIPHINSALEEKLNETFYFAADSFKKFRQDTIKKTEAEIAQKDQQKVEESITSI